MPDKREAEPARLGQTGIKIRERERGREADELILIEKCFHVCMFIFCTFIGSWEVIKSLQQDQQNNHHGDLHNSYSFCRRVVAFLSLPLPPSLSCLLRERERKEKLKDSE